MTVGQYKEMSELVYDDLSQISHNIELISIYDDLDPDDVRKMSASKSRERVREIHDAVLSMGSADSVQLDGEELFRKDFSDLTLGEFIDMDNYLIGAEIHKMLAVLYRRRTGGGMDKYDYEPYAQVNIDYRSERFLDVEANTIIGVVADYKDYRNMIISTYKSLFGDEDEDVITEEDVMTESERKIMEAQELHGQFAWESFILFLCNDDITKWEQVTGLHLVLAFNIASYRKSVLRNAQ